MHDHEHGHNGHEHSHGQRGMLFTVKVGIVLNFTLCIAHFVIFLYSGSIAVLGASGENLIHGSILIASHIFLSLSKRPPNRVHTYGLKRLRVFAPLFNALFLLVVGTLLIREGTGRIINSQEVIGYLMMIVATIDIASNLIQLGLMWRYNSNETIKSIIAHISLDSLAAFGVIAGGYAIYKFNFYSADGIAAVVIGAISIISASVFIWRAKRILLEGVPKDISLEEVKKHIASFEGISDVRDLNIVHDLHIWELTRGYNVLSCHIIISNKILQEWVSSLNLNHANDTPMSLIGTVEEFLRRKDGFVEKLRESLRKKFEIAHPTIQLEFEECVFEQEV